MGMPNLDLTLDNGPPQEIDMSKYELVIKQLKAKEAKLHAKQADITKWSMSDLANAYDITDSFKVVLDIGIEISFRKFGDPISKKGYAHKYNSEWIQEDLDDLLEEFPEKRNQWLKSYKTRLRKIIRGDVTDKKTGARKNLYSIKGFISFLAKNYREEIAPAYQQGTDDIENYTGVKQPSAIDLDITMEEIPF